MKLANNLRQRPPNRDPALRSEAARSRVRLRVIAAALDSEESILVKERSRGKATRLLDRSPCLKAGDSWADAAHAAAPRGTPPLASDVVSGAVVVGPTPPACMSVGPTVDPAVYPTGRQAGEGRFSLSPGGRGLHARELIKNSYLTYGR